jgi:D-glycero-D-manno-heptose 1,7-bisphosphate phosphatase
MMQAVILAGGRGQRLGSLTDEIPKPLLPISGKPFMSWLIRNILRFGFKEILVLAGYKGEKIKHYLEENWAQYDIKCVIEEEPLGTAGALRNSAEFLRSQFFLFNGDTIFDFNYLDLKVRMSAEALGCMALRETEDAFRYGSVVLNGNFVCRFQEKNSKGPSLVNGGVYILRKRIVDLLPPAGSLENDFFPSLPRGSLVGYPYQGFFIDIGVPDDYLRAQSLIPSSLKKPAVFLDRDGTLNEDKGYVYRKEDFNWLPGVKEAIKYLNDLGYLVIVVTNQAGIARGYYSEQQMHELHEFINKELAEIGAHIDAYYYCPHHPTEGKPPYLQDCDCRKPKPGLILRAAKDWDIDLEASIGIGDKDSDIQAFEGAGLKYIGRSIYSIYEMVKRQK